MAEREKKLTPEEIAERTAKKLEADEKEHEAVRAQQIKEAAARAEEEEKERAEQRAEEEKERKAKAAAAGKQGGSHA